MKVLIELPKLFGSVFLGVFLAAISIYSAAAAPDGFMEEFDDSVLNPAWQIVEFAGTRVNRYTTPANHFSLTDSPGHLRYRLDPMTHYNGFANDFQTSSNHNPGLELQRTINGEDWLLKTKVTYYLSYTTERGFAFDVYFGDGDVGSFSVQFLRERDMYKNSLRVILAEKTGDNPWDDPLLADAQKAYAIRGGSNISTLYFKLERSGSILTAEWSEDDVTWNNAFTYDMGTLLDGLEQNIVIAGSSGQNTGGAYADYDYIDVTTSSLSVDVDIKPGSDLNTVNLKSKGVITVAILSSEDFDAATVDPLSITFGPDEALEAHDKGHLEDTNDDGYDDLLLHFRTQETGITSDDTEACLTGVTINGLTFMGCDEIQPGGK